MRARTTVAFVAVLAALAGCSHAAASAATVTSAPPGPQAFVSWVKAQGTFGSKSFDGAGDDQILNMGNVVCGGFNDNSLSYGRVVQGLMESAAHPGTGETEALIRQSVTNLCPQYLSYLPAAK